MKGLICSVVLALSAVLVLTLAPRGAIATQTVTLGPAQDNTLYGEIPGGQSNGAGQHFFAGVNLDDGVYRGLVAFDIADAIPFGATILNVTLTLHMSRTLNGPQTMTLHVVSQDWGEGTTDAAGNEGGGAAPSPNDVTWLHTFFTLFWANPGGDFSATVSASAVVNQPGFYVWSDPQMKADVQTGYSPSTDFGWLLMGNESDSPTSKRFDSKENGDPAVWPALEVEYELPVPTDQSTWGVIKALYR